MLPELEALIEAEAQAAAEAIRARRRVDACLARSTAPEAPKPGSGDGLATKRELAATLACSVSTIDRMRPPSVRVGRSQRYDVVAVRAWLAEQERAGREARPWTPEVLQGSAANADPIDIRAVADRAGLRRRGAR